MLDGTYFFECSCYDDEHTVKFVLDKGYYTMDNGKDSEYETVELYMSTFLSTRGFFGRLWLGVKYIFGYRSRYGYFGNWTLREEDIEKLESLIKDYKDAIKELNSRKSLINI